MDFQILASCAKIYLEPLAYLVAVLGVPWALILYRRDAARQREEREVGTYSSLDDKYLHYLELVLQYPELNLIVPAMAGARKYTQEQKVQRNAMFETLISIFERAYLLYANHSDRKRQTQWTGWVSALQDWKNHPDFEQLWSSAGQQFDDDFIAFVNRIPPAKNALPLIT
jgi:hypothetical protein